MGKTGREDRGKGARNGERKVRKEDSVRGSEEERMVHEEKDACSRNRRSIRIQGRSG